MSNRSLYQLTHLMETLLEEEDVTEHQLQETFGDIQQKAASVCQYLAVLQGQVDVFKTEEKRLSDRRKVLENQETRIKQYIKDGMATIGESKLTAGTFSISVSPSQGKLVIDDATLLPAKFLIVVPATTVPNNEDIKKALKNNEAVAGAHIEPGTTLKIR